MKYFRELVSIRREWGTGNWINTSPVSSDKSRVTARKKSRDVTSRDFIDRPVICRQPPEITSRGSSPFLSFTVPPFFLNQSKIIQLTIDVNKRRWRQRRRKVSKLRRRRNQLVSINDTWLFNLKNNQSAPSARPGPLENAQFRSELPFDRWHHATSTWKCHFSVILVSF